VKVEVAGYTDSASAAAHNQQLSTSCANAVRDYLISKGIDASRLTAKGYGESNPIADNGTTEGRFNRYRAQEQSIPTAELQKATPKSWRPQNGRFD
jgi:OOP family OmpA-OmpF porin